MLTPNSLQTQVPTRVCAGNYETIDHVAETNIFGGDVVVINQGVFIALTDIPAGHIGALAQRGGRFVGPKKNGETLQVNAQLFYDPDGNPAGGQEGTGAFTGQSTGNVYAGIVTKAAASGDVTVEFALDCVGVAPVS